MDRKRLDYEQPTAPKRHRGWLTLVMFVAIGIACVIAIFIGAGFWFTWRMRNFH